MPKNIRAEILAAVVIGVALLQLSAAAQSPLPKAPAPEFAKIRAFIQQAVDDGGSPSVSVGLVRDGSLVWAEGFGFADRERKLRATPDTIYPVASVSKPLSATGLMQVVERGLIDLDKPANQYLGAAKLKAYAGSADEMTVRRLANHTAGLSTHHNFFYGTRLPSMDESILRYGFAWRQPGTVNHYSNLGYGVLGYIVERMTKMPWGQYQERRLYDPLKMTRTSDRVRPGFERDQAAQYVWDIGGRWVKWEPYESDHRASSAVHSTVNDLARFARMHLNGGELDGVRVLKAESVKEMQRLTNQIAPGIGTGVAWTIMKVGSHPSIGHSGNMPGVTTQLYLFPEDRAATIVLTNGDNGDLVQQVNRKLAQAIYPDLPDIPTPQPGTQSPPPVAPVAPVVSEALIGVWKGRVIHHQGDIPLQLTISKQGVVDASFGNRSSVALKDVVLTAAGFTGFVQGYLGVQAGQRGVPDLRFRLTLRDGKLVGVCSTTLSNHFWLPHWVELDRAR